MFISLARYLTSQSELVEELSSRLHSSVTICLTVEDLFQQSITAIVETDIAYIQILDRIKPILRCMKFLDMLIIESRADAIQYINFSASPTSIRPAEYFLRSFLPELSLRRLTFKDTRVRVVPSTSLEEQQQYAAYLAWVRNVRISVKSLKELEFNLYARFLEASHFDGCTAEKLHLYVDRYTEVSALLALKAQDTLKNLKLTLRETIETPSNAINFNTVFVSLLTYLLARQRSSLQELIVFSVADELLATAGHTSSTFQKTKPLSSLSSVVGVASSIHRAISSTTANIAWQEEKIKREELTRVFVTFLQSSVSSSHCLRHLSLCSIFLENLCHSTLLEAAQGRMSQQCAIKIAATKQRKNNNNHDDYLNTSLSTAAGSPPLAEIAVQESGCEDNDYDYDEEGEVEDQVEETSLPNISDLQPPSQLQLEVKPREGSRAVCKNLVSLLGSKVSSLKMRFKEYADSQFSEYLEILASRSLSVTFWGGSTGEFSFKAVKTMEFLRWGGLHIRSLELESAIARSFNEESQLTFTEYLVSTIELKRLRINSSLFSNSMEFFRFLLCLTKSSVRHLDISGQKFNVVSAEAFKITAWKTFLTSRLRSLSLIGQKVDRVMLEKEKVGSWRLLSLKLDDLAPTANLAVGLQKQIVENSNMCSFAHRNMQSANLAHSCYVEIEALLVKCAVYSQLYTSILEYSPTKTFWDLYLD